MNFDNFDTAEIILDESKFRVLEEEISEELLRGDPETQRYIDQFVFGI